MAQYAFFFDQSRCTNCHACSIACKDWNYGEEIKSSYVKWLRMMQWEKGVFPEVEMHTLFATCYHCEKPICVDACPNDALFKEDQFGAVLLDSDKCKGSRQCWIACPYGAPQYEDNAPGTPMSKCTMCVDRLAEGMQPICTLSCPLRAFDFGPLDQLIEKYGDVRYCEGMPSPEATKPAYLVWNPREKTPLIPYPVDEAIALNQQRGDLGTMFESEEDLTTFDEGTIRRDKLQMKFDNNIELMRATRNDMA